MLARNRLIVVCLALFLSSCLPSRVAAQTYRDEKRHFSIELPKGWQPMSQSEIDLINAKLGGGLLGGGVHYDGGLRKKSSRLGTYPYILIQSIASPPQGSSFQDIEKSMSVDMKAPIKEVQGRLGDLIKDLEIGKPVLNRESKSIVLRTQATVPGVGDIKGFSIGHLGKENTVFIHGYAKANDFDACFPVFRRVNDWFSFDKGYDFKPGAGNVGLFSWQSTGRSTIIGGVIGLLVGLGGFLFRFMYHSNSAKAPAVSDKSEFDTYL